MQSFKFPSGVRVDFRSFCVRSGCGLVFRTSWEGFLSLYSLDLRKFFPVWKGALLFPVLFWFRTKLVALESVAVDLRFLCFQTLGSFYSGMSARSFWSRK